MSVCVCVHKLAEDHAVVELQAVRYDAAVHRVVPYHRDVHLCLCVFGGALYGYGGTGLDGAFGGNLP